VIENSQQESPGELVERLARAINEHDLEGLQGCFAPDYVNETPAHPARGFRGSAQVRRNWDQIFAAVPEITATVRWTADGDTLWSEWEMRGTRRDGAPHLMRGVVIFGVVDNQASWARFYLEPVEEGGGGIDAAVRDTVGAPSQSASPGDRSRGER
jgi:ketosteroid isomerase-like protein